MVGQGRQIWLGVDHEVGRKMMKVTEVVRGWKKRFKKRGRARERIGEVSASALGESWNDLHR
jgi:hypothetical protein